MKKKSFLALIILCIASVFIAAFAGCGIIETGNQGNGDGGNGSGGNKNVAVTSVALSESAITLTEGETATLLVNIMPDNATDKSVSWSTSNADVATVSNGTVTAVKAGTAQISVITSNELTAACTVTVTELAPPPGGTWVMFDMNGHGSPSQPSKITDGKAIKPVDPTDNDYDFGGWFEDKDCTGTAVDFTTKTFDGNTVLYAKWTKKIVTPPTPHEHTYKYESLNATSHKKTCSGCSEVNITEAHNFGSGNICAECKYEKPTTPPVVDPTPHEHTYVYEKLNETNHKKTCSGCSEVNITEAHNFSGNICADCKYEKVVTPPVVDPTPHEHTYVYEKLNETNHKKTCSGCSEVNITEAHNFSGNICTDCKYEKPTTPPVVDPTPTKYTVTFISDGKTVDTQTVEEGQKAKEPTGVTSEGYTFKYWAEGSLNGEKFEVAENPVESDLTLYAVWEKNETPDNPPEEETPITYSYAGNECAAFEWTESNAANAKVEYKKSSESAFTAVDKQLIRSIGGGKARVDIVGLAGGVKYDFKITASDGKSYTKTEVEISAHDRSGYAHFGKSDGVGAYNNDGTPKANAQIIYLTEANKNNVDGKGNSIAKYLANAKNNSNPIIVRVIGTVGSATWNLMDYGDKYGKESSGKTPLTAALVSQLTKRIDGKSGSLATSGEVTYYQDASSYGYKSGSETLVGVYNTLNLHPSRKDGLYDNNECAAINGLNSYMKVKSGEYDSCWNDCPIQNVKNVTIEGIGEDAEIFQWGFTFKNSSSIEVRNLHFDDYTEDACSFEGGESSATALSDFKTSNIWLHHNTFDEGMNYWDVCAEQDKGDGDGSTDFKGLKNITIAYNHYIQTHKTNLIGGGDSVSTANVTFHHNYYESCNQRMPLGRQANMHMYNNYYSGSTLYSISLRAGAYAFIENCYFTEDASNHYPVELVKGSYGAPSAKIINCSIDAKKVKNGVGDAYLYIGNNRNATVDTSGQRFAKNFDTNHDLFYYDSTNKKSDVTEMLTAEQVKTQIPKVAGVQKRGDGTVSGGTTSGGTTTGGDSGNTGDNPGTTTGGEQTQSGTVIIFSNGAKTLVGGNLSDSLTGVTVTKSESTTYKSNKFVYNGVEYSNSYKLDSKGEVTVRLTETKEVTFCYYEYNGKDNPQISIGGETYGGGNGTTDKYGRYFTVKVTLQANTDYKIIRLNGVEIDLCYMLVG